MGRCITDKKVEPRVALERRLFVLESDAADALVACGAAVHGRHVDELQVLADIVDHDLSDLLGRLYEVEERGIE